MKALFFIFFALTAAADDGNGDIGSHTLTFSTAGRSVDQLMAEQLCNSTWPPSGCVKYLEVPSVCKNNSESYCFAKVDFRGKKGTAICKSANGWCPNANACITDQNFSAAVDESWKSKPGVKCEPLKDHARYLGPREVCAKNETSYCFAKMESNGAILNRACSTFEGKCPSAISCALDPADFHSLNRWKTEAGVTCRQSGASSATNATPESDNVSAQ